MFKYNVTLGYRFDFFVPNSLAVKGLGYINITMQLNKLKIITNTQNTIKIPFLIVYVSHIRFFKYCNNFIGLF